MGRIYTHVLKLSNASSPLIHLYSKKSYFWLLNLITSLLLLILSSNCFLYKKVGVLCIYPVDFGNLKLMWYLQLFMISYQEGLKYQKLMPFVNCSLTRKPATGLPYKIFVFFLKAVEKEPYNVCVSLYIAIIAVHVLM